LINKIQDCINKCQVSTAWSVASVCCIWNDYFGDFLKPFLDTFSKKLRRQLKEVQNLEPRHQKELLKLETEAKQAENEYKENKAKANQETDPDKKAQFVYLANKAAKKAEEIKRKVKANPLADLSRFSNLNDLEILLGGNIPKNSPSSGSKRGQESSGSSENFFEQHKIQIFVLIGLLAILFAVYNQKEEVDEDIQEDKKFIRQVMLMKVMNSKAKE